MKAEAIWELNRITISLDGTDTLLLEDPREKDRFAHGTVRQGQIDLTVEEAEQFAKGLLAAIHQHRTMDHKLREYMSAQEHADA